MRELSIFYAWQDDTEKRFNHFLIRTALEVAAERLNADTALGVKLSIDADTEGVPGWAPVTATILEKIELCDIFVPDVSFVCKTAAGKLVPNANVMFESGYAMHAVTFKAMTPVMNTFYGPPDKLPFDMGHLRHPISYIIDPASKNAERRAVRAKLALDLEKKLRLQIIATSPPAPPPIPFPRADERDGYARFRTKGEAIGRRWDSMAKPDHDVFLSEGPAIWLRLMPELSTGQSWPAHELKKHAVRTGSLNLTPFLEDSFSFLRAEDGVAICCLETPARDTETASVAFLFNTGEIWSIDTALLHYSGDSIPYLEKEFVNRFEDYVRLLSGLSLKPPYRWIAGLADIKNRRLAPVPGQVHIPGLNVATCLSDIIKVEGLYDGQQTPASALSPLFELIFEKCGVPRPRHLSS